MDMLYYTGMLKLKRIMAWQILTFNAFPEIAIGDDDGITIIVRDRANEDKVVEVREPLDTVALTYNPENENRLAFAKTVYPDYDGAEVSQIIKLGYEDYLNSKNEIDNVVVTVEQRTYVKKKNLDNINITYPDGGQEVKYMKLENELQKLIDKNSKGS